MILLYTLYEKFRGVKHSKKTKSPRYIIYCKKSSRVFYFARQVLEYLSISYRWKATNDAGGGGIYYSIQVVVYLGISYRWKAAVDAGGGGGHGQQGGDGQGHPIAKTNIIILLVLETKKVIL